MLGTNGNDTLASATGNATIDGAGGDDSITAAGWNNLLLGGPGNDAIEGGAGNTTIDGGAGDNSIHVVGWNDSILGGDGHNSVTGPQGNTTVTLGHGGNAVALAGWGNRVTTGDGADSITAGDGNATVASGGGDDTIALGLGGGDLVDGGAGTDRVVYSGAASAYTVQANADGSLTVQGPGGQDVLRNIETLHFQGGGADLSFGGTGVAPGGLAANRVIFVADDGTHGRQLWISDGSAGGTLMLAELAGTATPHGISGPPVALGLLDNGEAGFLLPAGNVGGVLYGTFWTTDGTAAGTVARNTIGINTGIGGYTLNDVGVGPLTSFGSGTALLEAAAGPPGYYLFGTDATASFTTLAVSPGIGLTPIGDGVALFTEFWSGAIRLTDGTTAGTIVLGRDALPEFGGEARIGASLGNGSFVLGMAPVGDLDVELWLSDGTLAGTHLLADILPTAELGPNLGGSHPAEFARFGTGQALFSANDGVHGRELWITDGSLAGTRLVRDLYAAPSGTSSNPHDITDLGNGKAVLLASTGNPTAMTLLATDGTPGGTISIAALTYVGLDGFTALGNGLAVFGATGGVGNTELWVTDGSFAGTHQLAELNPGGASSSPRGFAALGDGRAFFTADDGTHGEELWITDGTAAGTHLVADIHAGLTGAVPMQLTAIHVAPLLPQATTGYGQALTGGNGNDTLTSAFGSATLNGGGGDDSIVAAGWNNVLAGGAGNDTIDGGAGNASIDGGAGDNLLHALGWNDTILGGDGHNIVTGPQGGATVILGNGGNEVTLAGWGNSVSTGSGADSIMAGDGNATVASGGGNDSIALGHGGGDSVDGGAGSDTVFYTGNAAEYRIARQADGSLLISGQGGQDTLRNVELLRFADGQFNPLAPTPHDLDGDHRADLVLQFSNADVWAWRMDGPRLLAAAEVAHPPLGWQVIDTADFSGDGKSDIILQHAYDGRVYGWQMNGTALAHDQLIGAPSAAWKLRATGDLNGDGTADLVFHNQNDGSVYAWEMQGFTIIDQGTIGNLGASWDVVGVGDFGGDGKADILQRNSATGDVALWTMTGLGVAASEWLGNEALFWQVKAVADFDGDGKADILWRNSQDGTVYLWQMDGATVKAQGIVASVGTWWDIGTVADLNGDGRSDIVFQAADGGLFAWELTGVQMVGGDWLGNPGAGWALN